MYEIFGINKKDVVSVVGSGGKTTLIKNIAKELKNNGKVLSTTTTKIRIPDELEEDENYFENINDCLKEFEYNLIITGKGIKKGKVDSIDEESLRLVEDKFEYILIEADGSKELPYKAWREFEPVILNQTTKTIGILPVDYLNNFIPESKIFNLDKFIYDFESIYLDYELINKIISHKDGLFKNSKGEKILFINCRNLKINETVIKTLEKIDKSKVDRLIYGSKEEGYYEY